jgi:membrane protein implicated in regulation of membrane protease activity
MTEVQTYRVKRVNPVLLVGKLFLFSLILGPAFAALMIAVAIYALNFHLPIFVQSVIFAAFTIVPFCMGANFGLKANNSKSYIELAGNILRQYNNDGKLVCIGELTQVVALQEHRTKFGGGLFIRFADNSLAGVGSGLENAQELMAKVREMTNIQPSILTQDQLLVLVRELNARNRKA